MFGSGFMAVEAQIIVWIMGSSHFSLFIAEQVKQIHLK